MDLPMLIANWVTNGTDFTYYITIEKYQKNYM